MKAFGPAAAAPPATLWYEKNFPPFIDYDQDGKFVVLFKFQVSESVLISLCLVPIYDAQLKPFMFTKDDFSALTSLPRYKKMGDPKLADLSPSSLVSVFFTMNTYMSTRVPPTPSSSKSSWQGDSQTPGAASKATLSLNVQFLVYHGEMPEADSDED